MNKSDCLQMRDRARTRGTPRRFFWYFSNFDNPIASDHHYGRLSAPLLRLLDPGGTLRRAGRKERSEIAGCVIAKRTKRRVLPEARVSNNDDTGKEIAREELRYIFVIYRSSSLALTK